MRLPLRRDVLALTLPVFFEQFFVTLLGMVNTMMAARLGREAVSAVGMVDTINQIMVALFSALAIGASVVVAQYVGRGDRLRAGQAAAQTLVAGTAFGATLTALAMLFDGPLLGLLYGDPGPLVSRYMREYLLITALGYPLTAASLLISAALRGAGETQLAMKANTLMNVLNVVAGYVLIYGLELNTGWFSLRVPSFGVVGAACAITLARAGGTLYLLLVLHRQAARLPVRLRGFRFEPALLRPVLRVGIPAGIESFVFNGGKLLVQVMIVSLGTAAVAANFIAFSIAGLLNIVGSAFAVSVTTLVGQAIGRGDEAAAERDMRYVLRVATLLLAALGLLSAPLARPLVLLYTHDSEVIRLASHLVLANSLLLFAFPATFVLPNALKAAGDVRYTLFTTLAGMVIFRICLAYLFGIVFGMGVLGVWFGMFADWLARSALYLLRLAGGRWKGRRLIS